MPRHGPVRPDANAHAPPVRRGVRGPKGGYELARERRRITVGEIVRAALSDPADDDGAQDDSKLATTVVNPVAEKASEEFLSNLDAVTVEDLCQSATQQGVFSTEKTAPDFTI